MVSADGRCAPRALQNSSAIIPVGWPVVRTVDRLAESVVIPTVDIAVDAYVVTALDTTLYLLVD